MIPKNRLIYSSWFKTFATENPIEICDVGAREELFKPFDSLPNSIIRVHGFEPDSEEAERLQKRYEANQRTYYPYGLWSESTLVDLSLAELAGNSSIHPPNIEHLSKVFPPLHWTNRRPIKTLSLPVKSLDDVISEHKFGCDLLKIDTQGSEFEILIGAERALKEAISFVLLETWTMEVHKGQALSGKIMEWMHSKGFALIRTHNGADWHRKEVDQLNRVGLRTLVGLDLLFVRVDFKFTDNEFAYKKIVKSAALAELYGFPDLALQIIDQNKGNLQEFSAELNSVKSLIVKNWSKSHEAMTFRAVRKFFSLLGYSLEKHHSDPYAPLH
ncbi:MAG: FkbM family methyltransferase [Salibacteraceae bacterium]